MPDYFISELGAGLQDGTSPDNAWSAADMNAGLWSALGIAEGAGNNIYFLGTMTTICTPSFGAGGAAGALTIIRGDYPGQEATFTTTGGTTFSSSRPYIRYQGIYFKDIDDTAITMGGSSDFQEVTLCRFDNIMTGVFLNSSEFSLVYNNLFNEGAFTDYCVRAINTAHDYDIHHNTINGYIPPLALLTGDDDTTPSHNGIMVFNNPNCNGEIHHNRIRNLWGDGIHTVHQTASGTAPSHLKIYSNIIGPRVKGCTSLEGGNNIEFYNNTLIMDEFLTDPDPTFKMGNNFGAGTPVGNSVVKNNVFISDLRICISGDPVETTNTLDNNIYFNNRSDISIVRWNDGVEIDQGYSLANFRSIFGYELNGKYEDQLLDSSYVPTSNSPCVTAGIKWWTGVNKEGFNGEPFSDFDTDSGANQSTFGPFHPKNL